MTLSQFNFSIGLLPEIRFGAGRITELSSILASRGARRLLLVTGARSFINSPHWRDLLGALSQANIGWEHCIVAEEPSPQLIDETVARFHGRGIDTVVAIGGGSVLDAGKAIAGLLPFGNSVLDHLEGVGKGIEYTGPAAPFIAVPTTAGTGSEATKNAVLSVQGPQGYKKSFRHDTLVPKIALIDPSLLASCPPAQVAANGMDAFTQLLESYVSSNANAFTDALAWSGMSEVRDSLLPAWRGEEPQATAARAGMAFGALMSGICLAQAGLGSVHGLASPLGAFFPIPHGVACGSVLAAATETNILALTARSSGHPSLKKYARVGRLLNADLPADAGDDAALRALIQTLQDWTRHLQMPRLREYGVTAKDFPKIVANSRGNSMKTNPIVLSDEEITEILERVV